MFVQSIEEVRKEIMKRRLQNEIFTRKKFTGGNSKEQESKDFENSLLRLASMAKSRIKISDFTASDRHHLLDLFVNNEKTLLKIYEVLFPHRALGIQDSLFQHDARMASTALPPTLLPIDAKTRS